MKSSTYTTEIKIQHQANFIAKWNLCYFDKSIMYMYNYIVSDKTAVRNKKEGRRQREVKTFQNETLSMPS